MRPNNVRKKSYRQNVAAVILSSSHPRECQFFVGQCCGMNNRWQFPQGGIDENETPYEALLRELQEEIGYNDIEVLGEFPEWITYDFPKTKSTKMYPFDGQTQKYFLVRLKDDTMIKLDAYEIPEFHKHRFMEYEDVFKRVTYFKRRVYRRVIDYFIKEGLI